MLMRLRHGPFVVPLKICPWISILGDFSLNIERMSEL
jgi:hypothetical protein